MQLRCMLFMLLLLMCLASASACASGRASGETETPGAAESPEQNARRLGDSLLKSIQAEDYREFSSALAGRTGFDIPKKDFDTSAHSLDEKFGRIRSWEYLTGLKTPFVLNQIWKVRFVRGLPASGTEMEQDMLFRLVTSEEDGQTHVLALGFF